MQWEEEGRGETAVQDTGTVGAGLRGRQLADPGGGGSCRQWACARFQIKLDLRSNKICTISFESPRLVRPKGTLLFSLFIFFCLDLSACLFFQ